jgi:ADP-heptose:LPS heptosyltransferase
LKKILVIRFSSIGDIVLTTPVIRCIKQQLKCELHVLTRKQYADLTRNNPHVDKVHPYSNDLDELISVLKKENFHHVVDLQRNMRSLKVRRKLGKPSSSFPKLNRQKWLLVNFRVNKLPHVHIVDRYFHAAAPLGVTNDGRGLDYFIPEKDKVSVSSLNKALARGYVGFVIGSRHETKMLPVGKIAETINKLQLPVVLLGGTEDKARAEEVMMLTRQSRVMNTCGQFSLNQSASLVEQAKVVITNDTGLMHIAAAFNKPIISVWGNTVPDFGMYPYLPEGKGQSFISEVDGLMCRPCSKLGYKKCPKKHFDCMMMQDVDVIVKKVDEFITPR